MNILKIITRSRNIYENKINELKLNKQKHVFYRFNDLLKIELHYQKHIIKELNYYKNNKNIECHFDVIISDEKDNEKIKNNNIIQSLIKKTIIEEDILIEINYLKHTKKISDEINNTFLL